jgi:predicted anti-sigma-YlaC factor YlaD
VGTDIKGTAMGSTCSSARHVVERGLDGEQLREAEKRELDAHLLQCAACRTYEADLRLIVGIAERLPREMAPQTLFARVMHEIPAAESVPVQRAGWLQRLGWLWAPLSCLAGVFLLIYRTLVTHGVSLLNLPRAIAEWAAMIDLADLGSVISATSSLSWSVEAEMVLALALLAVGIFGVMVHVMSRQPSMRLATHHS